MVKHMADAPTTTQTDKTITKADTAATAGYTLDDILGILLSYRYRDFYALLLSSLPKEEAASMGPMDKDHFTMGVVFKNGHHTLKYNPEWVAKKVAEGPAGFADLRATIAHEAMHIVLMHIPRQVRLMKLMNEPGKEKEVEKFLQISNLATDSACNDLLVREKGDDQRPVYKDMHTNPGNWIFPQTLDMPEDNTYDWYVDLLMNKKGNGGSGGGKMYIQIANGAVDPNSKQQKHKGAHSQWGNGDGTDASDMSGDELEELATQAEMDAFSKVKQAVESQIKSRGTIPGNVQDQLDNALKPPEIPWKKEMSMWVANHRRSKPRRTMERPRKRFFNLGTTPFPGRRRDPTFHVMFSIDTSGSMSDKDIEDGLSELQHMMRACKDMTVTVVEFDTRICKVYDLDPNQKPEANVYGRGGTDFNEAFQYAVESRKKKAIDALIVYTDGYAPAPEVHVRPHDIPVLWCLTAGGQEPCPGYGRVVRRKS